MEVARYATPYLARSDFALSPSPPFKASKSPASRPYFSVVSSAAEGVSSVAVVSDLVSSLVLKMWRADADDVDGVGCLSDVVESAAFRRSTDGVEDEVWKEREPSRMASATMRDFANTNTRERSMIAEGMKEGTWSEVSNCLDDAELQ